MDAHASTCTSCGHGPAVVAEQSDTLDVFRLVGEYWAIRFEGRACNVRDSKGLGYLAQLLRVPGREVYALDLIADPARVTCPPKDPCGHGGCTDAYAVAERARLSVTRAIRRAQARVAACHPSLGRHLETTIRTGTYCAYVPDSRLPSTWDLGCVPDQSGGMRRT